VGIIDTVHGGAKMASVTTSWWVGSSPLITLLPQTSQPDCSLPDAKWVVKNMTTVTTSLRLEHVVVLMVKILCEMICYT
jgi:hypothetical protein